MPKNDACSLPSAPTLSFSIPAGAITVVTPRPAFVSQRTSLEILGVPRDRFLAMVRAPGFRPSVTIVGKLRMVETDVAIAYLRELGASPANLLVTGERTVESTSPDTAETSAESRNEEARKLGAALGFRMNETPDTSTRAAKRDRNV